LDKVIVVLEKRKRRETGEDVLGIIPWEFV